MADRGGGRGGGSDAPLPLPADALAVRGVLRSMGAEEAEPRVVAMLLDFVYTYAADVLQDAEAYAEALGRPSGALEAPEVAFAMSSRGGGAFCQPPPQEALQRVADEVNALELPPYVVKHGLRVPDEATALTKPNWELGPAAAEGGGGGGSGAGARRQMRSSAGGGGGGARGGGAGPAPMDVS